MVTPRPWPVYPPLSKQRACQAIPLGLGAGHGSCHRAFRHDRSRRSPNDLAECRIGHIHCHLHNIYREKETKKQTNKYTHKEPNTTPEKAIGYKLPGVKLKLIKAPSNELRYKCCAHLL